MKYRYKLNHRYDVDGPTSGGTIAKLRWKKALKDKRSTSAKERYLLHRQAELAALEEARRAA